MKTSSLTSCHNTDLRKLWNLKKILHAHGNKTQCQVSAQKKMLPTKKANANVVWFCPVFCDSFNSFKIFCQWLQNTGEMIFLFVKFPNFEVTEDFCCYAQKGKRLKLVSAIFYQICIFSPNDSPLKTMKNIFYFTQKALFVL